MNSNFPNNNGLGYSCNKAPNIFQSEIIKTFTFCLYLVGIEWLTNNILQIFLAISIPISSSRIPGQKMCVSPATAINFLIVNNLTRYNYLTLVIPLILFIG